MNAVSEVSQDPVEKTSRSLRTARRVARGLCLCAAVGLLLPIVATSTWAIFVPASSPLVATTTVLATHAAPRAAGLGIAVGLVAVFRRRWFCHWVCPTGLLADGGTRCGLRFKRRSRRLPPLGAWIALLTLGGACLGYPLLLWLDPLALFSSAFGVPGLSGGRPVWWSITGLTGVVLLSVAWPGLWCARLCPLGALQDLLADAARVVRSLTARSNEPARPVSGWLLTRRLVLGSAAGLLGAAAARRSGAAARPCLRPPNAADPTQFAGLCIRCGNCARACPAGIIEPDLGGQGIAGLLAPVVTFREDYCREDCTRCAEVCPSGALTAFTAAEKIRIPMGVPRVDMNLCLLGDDRECSLCRNHCPYEAIRLVFCEVEYTLTPQIDPLRCPGCGACEVACPTTPDKAIVVHAENARA